MDTKKLLEWRKLAENTTMVSALGEYTPSEFVELLDYTEALIAERDALKNKLKERQRFLHNQELHAGHSIGIMEKCSVCKKDLEGFVDD